MSKKHVLIYALSGLALSLILFFIQKNSYLTGAANILWRMSNATVVTGAAILLIPFWMYATDGGFFDGVLNSVRLMWNKKRKDADKFAEYTDTLEKKKSDKRSPLIVGAAYVLISIVLSFVFHRI